MIGRATVREHFPTQEISWIVKIRFIFRLLATCREEKGMMGYKTIVPKRGIIKIANSSIFYMVRFCRGMILPVSETDYAYL